MSGGGSARVGANMQRIPFPEVPPARGVPQEAVDLAKDATRQLGELESAKQRAILQVEEDTQNQREMNQAVQLKKEEAIREGIAKVDRDMLSVQEVFNNPAKTPDPERYWANHSKILFAIGVGMLAQAGKDINGVLSNVNAAIDRDVEQQKQEFEAPRKAAREKMSALQGMYARYRDLGHDVFEAGKMSEITLKQRALSDLAKIAANSNSQMAGPNQAIVSLHLQEGIAKAASELQNHTAAQTVAKFNAQVNQNADIAKNANDRAQLQLRANESGGGQKLSPDQQKRVDGALEGLNTVAQLRVLRGKPEGILGGSLESLLTLFPGTPASARRDAVDVLRFNLATIMSKSSVQAKEQEYWLGKDGKSGKLGSTGLGNLQQGDLDALEIMFTRARESALTGQPATSGAGGTRKMKLPSGEIIDVAN